MVFPLTIISFFVFTKWWDTLPVDAPGTIFLGFPLPYVCNGWHTSMSLQIFFLELILDLSFYFFVWLLIVYCINRYLRPVRIRKIWVVLLFFPTIIIMALYGWVASFPENIYYFNRDFDMKILSTGYRFVWQQRNYPSQ